MGELQTNRYITCASCNTVNKLHQIGDQGLYHCGTCKNPLIFINKEKPKSGILKTLVIAGMIGVAGGVGVNQIQDYLRPAEINYSQLKTSWPKEQVEFFEAKCKANLAQDKTNWKSIEIDKTCTCFTTYVVENSPPPFFGQIDSDLVARGIQECNS